MHINIVPFTSRVLIISLLYTTTFCALTKRTISNPITIGFEEPDVNPSASSQQGIGATPVYSGYKGLHWDTFFATSETAGISMEIPADGTTRFAVSAGSNTASFMTEYPGKTLRFFIPKYFYFNCYLSLKNALSPLVRCTIRITPFLIDVNSFPPGQRTFTPAFKDCTFSLAGGVDVSALPAVMPKCELPSSWTGMQALRFEIVDQPDATKLLAALADMTLASSIGSGLGKVGMAFDSIVMDQVPI